MKPEWILIVTLTGDLWVEHTRHLDDKVCVTAGQRWWDGASEWHARSKLPPRPFPHWACVKDSQRVFWVMLHNDIVNLSMSAS